MENDLDFTDKRVLVTGSSRGIGFNIAKTFLDAGARVAINGRTEQSVGAAMKRLGDSEHTIAAPGNIGPVADCDEAMWDAHADVNLKGLFFCCRAAIPELKKSDHSSEVSTTLGQVQWVVFCLPELYYFAGRSWAKAVIKNSCCVE